MLARLLHIVGIGTLALLPAGPALASVDVSAANTSINQGSASVDNNVQGAGINVFGTTRFYNVHFSGAIHQVDSIEAGPDTYLPTLVADQIKVRRFATVNPRQNNSINWFTGVGETSDTDIYLAGEKPTDYESTFATNNLLVGIDNLFVNIPEGSNNYSNVERLDYIFTGGIVVTESLAFTIFERGNANQHDGFKIAGITARDNAGDPSAYGTLKSFGVGQWGETDLIAPTNHIVLRDNVNTAAIDYRPSQNVVQSIGAVLIQASDLAPIGSTIYGYSLFGADVLATGAQLVDYSNPIWFPQNTNGINGHSRGGGLDLIGASSVLFERLEVSAPLPEPTVLAPLALVAMAALRRRK